MDKLEKALGRLSFKERAALKIILERILSGEWRGLDIKKLKGHEDIYRVRKGDLRVIYRLAKDGVIKILAVERRSDTTYNRF